jgi:hypothetical protein
MCNNVWLNSIYKCFDNKILSNLNRKAFNCVMYVNFFSASNNCWVLQKIWYNTGYKNIKIDIHVTVHR